MRKILIIGLFLFTFGCQKAEEVKIEANSNPNPTVQPTKNEVKTPEIKLPVDITKLVNKSSAEIDKIFGKPEQESPTEDGGIYRLYKIANEPKGLAVRFYGDKAKSFNLILNKPFPTSKEALKQTFSLDIGSVLPAKDAKEPLSDKYQGTFGGVKFSKVSAKKDEKGKGFIFVLAEVVR